MIRELFMRLRNMVFSLRVSILAIFIVLFAVAMITLVFTFEDNFSKSMKFIAKQLLAETADSIFSSLSKYFKDAKVETSISAKVFQNQVFDIGNTDKIMAYVTTAMERQKALLPSIQSVFWSDEEGGVYLAELDSNNNVSYQIVKYQNNTPIRTIITRNALGQVIKTETEPTTYDPRSRPWYQAAKTSGKDSITNPYRYIFFKKPFWGVTLSSPVYSKDGKLIGVFGENMRLDFLRELIKTYKVSAHSEIFIVSQYGEIIAYPHLVQYASPVLTDIHTIGNQAIPASFDLYQKNQQTEFLFKHNNKNYLATYRVLAGFVPENWYLGIVAPEDDFIGNLKKLNFFTALIGVGILFLGILIFSILITHAIRSLKLLIIETDKIKNFKLEEPINIKSRIKEVIYLVDALEKMKRGLRSFQKYVPAALVRQLIQKGIDAQLGGEKKQLVVFFSDIKDFTTISESADPNELMMHTCEYFEELSKIIIQQGGTIDKYIGDAIMAFWGAPLIATDPAYQAAKAALECQKRLEELNFLWKKQHLPPFVTRIGLHIGEAIVGNLGSSERLNYTALGDSINITSRLESANKIYRTKILVSEALYLVLKDRFWLRLVDKVALKGKESITFVYELLEEKSTPLSFDLDHYEKTFLKAFDLYQHREWDAAITMFHSCQEIFKDDQLAQVFIVRCQYLKVNPPKVNWNGAWHFSHK